MYTRGDRTKKSLMVMIWVDFGLMDYNHQEPLHCHGDPSQRHMLLGRSIKILWVLTINLTTKCAAIETCKFAYSFQETCILHSWRETHHWLQSGIRHALSDSLEDTLETPWRWGTSKEIRYLKIDSELSDDMHTAFLTWNIPLTPEVYIPQMVQVYFPTMDTGYIPIFL